MRYFDFLSRTEQVVIAGDLRSAEARLRARSEVGKREFPNAVRDAGLHFLPCDATVDFDRFPDASVIGTATWSDPDMAFLDQVVSQVPDRTSIFVFDVDCCQSESDIQRLIPGARPFFQTPVVAQFRSGKLGELFVGGRVKDWIESML